MVEIDSREKLAISNPMFLRIRQAALDKAFAEIRNKRFNLDESRSQGWISEEEYQQGLKEATVYLKTRELEASDKYIDTTFLVGIK